MILQGTFSAEFLHCLPDLEEVMSDHGLDPDDFVIAKAAGHSSYARMGDDYTVTIRGESFTVNMASDMEFLRYFYGICFPPEQDSTGMQQAGDLRDAGILREDHSLKGSFQRLEHWLAEDPLDDNGNNENNG